MLASRQVGQLEGEVRERGDHEGVIDLAGAQHRVHVGQRPGLDGDDLAAVEALRDRGLGVLGEEAVERVVLDRRVGRGHAEPAPPLGHVAGLLGELARGGLLGGLAGIDHAAGDLDADPIDAGAVLPDQHHAPVGRQRDHVDPVDALEQREPLGRAGARVIRLEERGGEDLVVVAWDARAELPAEVVGHAAERSSNSFCHRHDRAGAV